MASAKAFPKDRSDLPDERVSLHSERQRRSLRQTGHTHVHIRGVGEREAEQVRDGKTGSDGQVIS